MGRPILVDGESKTYVHQPKVGEVVDIGEDYFNTLLMPYLITAESIFGGMENEEELISKFNVFDLFFIETEDGQYLLDNVLGDTMGILEESMRFFLKADSIRFLKNRKKIIINDSYLISIEEFSVIRKIIQGVCNRSDVEVEKAPKGMTDRQKDIWNKIQKGRRRTAEKNALYMQDLINYVQWGGSSFISYDSIDKLTVYQLQNAYKAVMGIDAFHMGMGYKLSQKFEVKEDIKHWTDSLKIGK